MSGAARSLSATEKQGAGVSAEANPPQIQQLLTLLADPKVQQWLKEQNEAKSTAGSRPDDAEMSMSHYVDSRLGAIREHIVALAAALPDLPRQFQQGAALVSSDLGQRGRAKALLLLAIFVGLGFGVEWLLRKATQRIRTRLDGLPLETVHNRLHVVAARFAFAVGMLLAFAIGSVGAFLAFDWPPLLRELVAAYLFAILAIRVAMIFGRLLLAPEAERFRIVPVGTAAARFWCRRLTVFVGWFAFGFALFGVMGSLGYSLAGRQVVAYALGLGLLAIALEAVWRRPTPPVTDAEPEAHRWRHFGYRARNALLSIGFVLLWVLWVLRAMSGFWLLLVVITLPLAFAVTRRAVENLLRPPGAQLADGPPPCLRYASSAVSGPC
jgi:hypothetical protein